MAFILVLPFHNLVMAELWDAGVRGFALDVVSAWKEVLLAAAIALIVWRRHGVPFTMTTVDWLAVAYTAIVVLYALIPQDWLGGDASARGILYGVRHNLTPVACYFLGRSIALSARDRRIAGGMIATSVPARNTPYCCLYVPTYWFSTTGSVTFEGLCR